MQRRIRNRASRFLDPRHVVLISATPPLFLEGVEPKSLQLGETEPECRPEGSAPVFRRPRRGTLRWVAKARAAASKRVCGRKLTEEGWKSGPFRLIRSSSSWRDLITKVQRTAAENRESLPRLRVFFFSLSSDAPLISARVKRSDPIASIESPSLRAAESQSSPYLAGLGGTLTYRPAYQPGQNRSHSFEMNFCPNQTRQKQRGRRLDWPW